MKVEDMIGFENDGIKLTSTFKIVHVFDISQVPEAYNDEKIMDEIKRQVCRKFTDQLLKVAIDIIKEKGRSEDHLFPELGTYLETPVSDESSVITMIHPKVMYEKLKEMFG